MICKRNLYTSFANYGWLVSVVVRVKIKKETKEALERIGIDISLATRAYLEKLAWKSRRKKNLRELHRLIEKMVAPSRKAFSVASIREDRNNFSSMF